ncbi:MAG TPA: hypothetical protein VGT24_04315, partial [Candidatus Acidoferrales bacterium]|nr:hypothetical protein [Candidatus Acidoferrales bacterium]
FFHCASVSNGPHRAIDPPSALPTLLISHLRKHNHLHFRNLYPVMQQLVGILTEVLRPLGSAPRGARGD